MSSLFNKTGKRGRGRYSGFHPPLHRRSSPSGRDQRQELRLKNASSGEEFTKPGSGNPRKTGR